MKTKYLVTIFVALVLSSLILIFKFGLQPRPLPKIRLSSFENPIKFAQSIRLRLNDEIKKSPLLLFGYQAEKPDHLELIKEFLRANEMPGEKFEVIVADQNLRVSSQIAVDEELDTQKDVERLAQGLQRAVEAGQRVVVILPSIFSVQMLSGSVANILKRKYGLPVTSFSIVELLRTRDEEKQTTIPCLMKDADNTGIGDLGCAVLQVSRLNYRKKMEAGKKTGYMDQRGSNDYLIFMSNEAEK